MTVLGNLGVWVSVAAAGFSAALYLRAATVQAGTLVLPRRLVSAAALTVSFASVLLLILLLRHDFTNGYVYSYSDSRLPLHFLISSFYAGQEGSFLFWALCSIIIALILRASMHRRGDEAAVMGVFMTVQTALLLLVAVKSPFRSVWEMFPQAPPTVPPDGRGLNPLLQNFWMVIHPPVLFLGFAAMAAPFSFAVAGLWRRSYGILPARAFPWVLFATLVLGLGIMLGAYWAYGVLGWGGYWGWDPVENSSLVPWLTGVALLHTMLAQLRTQKYVRTNFALALVSFFLVVYSTFLTRSGILGDASVHSFTDPGASVYWLLLGFLGLIAVTSTGFMVARWNELRPRVADTLLLSREVSLGAGTIVLVLCALVVLFGTSLPIFSKVRVEPSFYDVSTLPLAVVIALLTGYSLYMQWEMQDGRSTLRRSVLALVAAGLATAVIVAIGVNDIPALLLIFTSLFALFVNVEIGAKIARGNPLFLGGKVAHAGLALFLLGVIATGKFGSKAHSTLQLGVPQEVLGHTLTYTGHTPTPDGKFAFTVRVEGRGDPFTLSPVMFEAGEQGVMRTPDIASFLTRDLYLAPLGLEEGKPGAGAETYTIAKGSSVQMGGIRARFVRFDMDSHAREGMTAGGGTAIGSVLELSDGARRETVVPVLIRANGKQEYLPTPSKLMNATIMLVGMNVTMGEGPSSVIVEVQRPSEDPATPEALAVEASIKPWVSLVWGGTLVMMVGFVLAILKRSQEA
ncbi:MAG: cytochrome c biogenesis protein CcsA [Bacteroidota bacterium]